MEKVDNALCCQHPTEPEIPAEENRSLLQTIWEQVVSDMDTKTALTGMELKAEHWQWKGATAAHRYTRAVGLLGQLMEETVGEFQDGNHPDKQ
jgi:hypothetical protein